MWEGIEDVEGLVEMLVEVLGVVKGRVEVDVRLGSGSVDEMVESGELGGLGIEWEKWGVGVLDDIRLCYILLLCCF